MTRDRTERPEWRAPRLVRIGTLRDVAGSRTSSDQGNGQNANNRS